MGWIFNKDYSDHPRRRVKQLQAVADAEKALDLAQEAQAAAEDAPFVRSAVAEETFEQIKDFQQETEFQRDAARADASAAREETAAALGFAGFVMAALFAWWWFKGRKQI